MSLFPFRNEENRYYFRDLFILSGVILFGIFLAELIHFRQNSDFHLVDRILVYFYYTVPLFILFLALSYFYRNKRNLETGRLKSSIRYRLSLSFLFVAILPSIPIFFLSSNIIGKVFEGFYGLDIAQALDSGDYFIRKELAGEKKDLIEKAKLLRNLVLQERPNAHVLTERSNQLDLITNPNYYVGWHENHTLMLESRTLKIPMTDAGQFIDSEEKGIQENINVQPNSAYYLLKIQAKDPSKYLILGKRIFSGEEEKAYALWNTRRNYLAANLAKEKLPYEIRLTVSLITIFTFLLSIIFSLVFARKISRPIIDLANATQKVSLGDTDINLPLTEGGEIGALVESFNQMVKDLKSKNEELMHSQRIAAWKEVAQRMAHEIKNPLTPIQLSAERIRRKLNTSVPENFQEIVTKGTETIIGQVKILEHLVNEFSEFARMPAPRLINQHLEPVVLESAKLFEHSPGIQIELNLGKNLPEIFLDKKLFQGIMNNLFKNAVEAIEKRKAKEESSSLVGKIRITTKLDRRIMRRSVVLLVEDNGIGISPDYRSKVFEPYYSTKDEHTSGIGLAIVQKTVIDHNGHISVDSSELGGCKFRIELPVA
ncbi:HAMP domain-containing protein [Leptospira wolffii]|uniref:LIC_11548 family sensor histidine kinase n=1 Tax=Leptospira wolffii TaxID=409998 RepID=UPI0010833CCA|nr:ATP-binding protein [Leptospira wolffii]TGK56716.1 HAMP domain-containing protein [Leptospira wolffii]TGK71702.1 HAMP domain-containing protein [Leptospira wolffii]TGK75441.1 HAMP domain-containing protein [Leptospira wolffii]TGL33069.1 HAMP domain-containing protein [Leptospira wolffii]